MMRGFDPNLTWWRKVPSFGDVWLWLWLWLEFLADDFCVLTMDHFRNFDQQSGERRDVNSSSDLGGAARLKKIRLRSNFSEGPWNTMDLNPSFDDQWKLIIDWLVLWNMFIHLIFFLIFHILGIIIPTDEFIFFRGVGQPPTSWSLGCWHLRQPHFGCSRCHQVFGRPVGEIWEAQCVYILPGMTETFLPGNCGLLSGAQQPLESLAFL